MPDLGRDVGCPVRYEGGRQITLGDRVLPWQFHESPDPRTAVRTASGSMPGTFRFGWAFDPERLILYVHEETRSAYEAWRTRQAA